MLLGEFKVSVDLMALVEFDGWARLMSTSSTEVTQVSEVIASFI